MVRLHDIHFSYPGGVPVLKGVDLELSDGLSLLVGPNGCGKTTLLKTAAGVERPERGVAQIEGLDLWKEEVAARRHLAYVPEQPEITPYATLKDVVDLVCRLRHEPLARGREVLAQVGLDGLRRRSIRELSMGQRRRVVLAAAWIGRPHVALLDEPLEAMDRAMREAILRWIEDLVAQKAAVIVATHQIEPFVAPATRVVTLQDGRCCKLEDLPGEPDEKTRLLEDLSRGILRE
jgi:ABC-type multidrug transport system ATPase subunit